MYSLIAYESAVRTVRESTDDLRSDIIIFLISNFNKYNMIIETLRRVSGNSSANIVQCRMLQI